MMTKEEQDRVRHSFRETDNDMFEMKEDSDDFVHQGDENIEKNDNTK
jgi:hypothetical protein